MMSRVKLTAEKLAECAEMRARGIPWKDCAAKYGASVPAIRHQARAAGFCIGGKPGKAEIPIESLLACSALRAEGLSFKECGERLGLNPSSLRDIMCRKKIPRTGRLGRVPKITPEIMSKAKEMHDEGKSWPDIGRKLGLNHESIRTSMVRKGFKFKRRTIEGRKESIARAKTLRSEGVCWKLIEREIGISREILLRGIKKLNQNDPCGS